MRRLRIVCAIGTAALASACATPWQVADVQTAIDSPPATAGSPFTQALFDEYRAHAKHKAFNDYNWIDAALFARKGLRAATGEAVAPESLSEWCVPEDRRAELVAARTRLDGYLAAGARDSNPAAAARAQVAYDCWVDQESRGDTISDCRTRFVKTEADLKPRPPAPPAAAAPAAQPGVVRSFTLYFDTGKTTLTRESRKILAEAIAARAQVAPAAIRVVGHADATGKAAVNERLSAARARAVAAALADRGIQAEETAVGQSQPAIATPTGQAEARNRRVVIEFLK